jgi:hypothetical protein
MLNHLKHHLLLTFPSRWTLPTSHPSPSWTLSLPNQKERRLEAQLSAVRRLEDILVFLVGKAGHLQNPRQDGWKILTSLWQLNYGKIQENNSTQWRCL